jgi:hypothetical protein
VHYVPVNVNHGTVDGVKKDQRANGMGVVRDGICSFIYFHFSEPFCVLLPAGSPPFPTPRRKF